jgi:glutathione synthase/RimK-type ligase-like ATP-grasp enzyme
VLAEIERSSCLLFNPLEAVRWNSEKSYLFDLAEWDVPIVPTEVVRAGAGRDLQEELVGRGWEKAVLKPRVGGGGAGIHLVRPREIERTLEELTNGDTEPEYLVQPFIESIADEGEWSFAFVDSELSHALIKRPAPGDYRTHGIYGGSVRRVEPRADDLALAVSILSRLPFDLLYARLDLVRVNGRLAVMEAELVEPIFYFDLAPEAAGRLADATINRLARTDA